MIKKFFKPVFFAFLSFLFFHIHGQSSAKLEKLFTMSLEELMNIEVNIATKTNQNLRKSPSIISVITEEDIRINHCRDFIDVINMVPGLNVVKDIDNGAVVSRGLYGFEGRMLFMVDGLELSGLFFGTYPIGDDFPIHMISRIEIIRGPGSVEYGGTAELAVINIITKSGSELNGANIVARYGVLPTSFGHRDLGINFGKKINSQVDFSMLVYVSDARRSDGPYTLYNWAPAITHREESAATGDIDLLLKTHFGENVIFKTSYHDWNYQDIEPFNFPMDSTPQAFEEQLQAHYSKTRWRNFIADLTCQFPLADNFNFSPSLIIQNNLAFDKPNRTDVEVTRVKGKLNNTLKMKGFTLNFGGEYFIDHAALKKDPLEPNWYDWFDPEDLGFRETNQDSPKSSINISNFDCFSSVAFEHGSFYSIVGIRYDWNELYGDKLSPRLGITYLKDKFNVKLLYSSAFRAPLIANNAFSKYGLNPAKPHRKKVIPESMQIIEMEMGYELFGSCYLTANVFHQRVDNIIEYRYEPKTGDLFSDNGGRIATQGFEMELKIQKEKYRGLFNVSYAVPELYDDPDNMFVENAKGGDTYLARHQPDELMGAPKWKFYANHSYYLTKDISIQLNMLYLSSKNRMLDWGKTETIKGQLIVDAGIYFKNITKNLGVSISMHDIANQRINLVTPFYDGGGHYMFHKGREISLALSYSL